eukprot:5225473-Heterocapsa_arctica.AAC.1
MLGPDIAPTAKRQKAGDPAPPVARRLVAGYRGHKIVKYGAIRACLASSYMESWRSTRAGFGIA